MAFSPWLAALKKKYHGGSIRQGKIGSWQAGRKAEKRAPEERQENKYNTQAHTCKTNLETSQVCSAIPWVAPKTIK